jgi:hypothetical protein
VSSGGGGQVAQTQTQQLCPISKLPIVDPVRLVDCGHVFDRASIEGIMKSRRRETKFK